MTTGDKLHTQVYERQPTEHDIIEGLGLMLKVNIKEKQPPLTVTLSLTEEAKGGKDERNNKEL